MQGVRFSRGEEGEPSGSPAGDEPRAERTAPSDEREGGDVGFPEVREPTRVLSSRRGGGVFSRSDVGGSGGLRLVRGRLTGRFLVWHFGGDGPRVFRNADGGDEDELLQPLGVL